MSLRAELVRLVLRWTKRRGPAIQDIRALRQRLDGLKRWIPGPPAGTKVTKLDAGGVHAVRVTPPRSLADRHVLYLHGGGYTYGAPVLYRDFIWRIATAASARVLCIDYRLAPEHPFPAAVDDAAAAYRWLLADGTRPQRTAVVGDSAGGGLVFAVLLRLRDEGVPLPAAAVAISPWTDLTVNGQSYRINDGKDPMIRTADAASFASFYLAGADPRNPYASPLHGDPAGLPPSLILVGSDEILYDDAVGMADKLRAAGCRVEIEIWPRMPHVWPLFARIVPEARRAVDRIGSFLDRELGGRGIS
jgi:epsilon-lactone hydrolase